MQNIMVNSNVPFGVFIFFSLHVLSWRFARVKHNAHEL